MCHRNQKMFCCTHFTWYASQYSFHLIKKCTLDEFNIHWLYGNVRMISHLFVTKFIALTFFLRRVETSWSQLFHGYKLRFNILIVIKWDRYKSIWMHFLWKRRQEYLISTNIQSFMHCESIRLQICKADLHQ